jgi:hypothetical protein
VNLKPKFFDETNFNACNKLIRLNKAIYTQREIKKNRHTDHFLGHDIKEKWNFEELSNWL